MTPVQQTRLAELKNVQDRAFEEEIEFRALSWFTDYVDRDLGWHRAKADAQTPMRINQLANRELSAEANQLTERLVTATAKKLTMPCWFIHGTQDPRPSNTVIDLASHVPAARIHLIEAAGHHPWVEKPGQLQQILLQLINT